MKLIKKRHNENQSVQQKLKKKITYDSGKSFTKLLKYTTNKKLQCKKLSEINLSFTPLTNKINSNSKFNYWLENSIENSNLYKVALTEIKIFNKIYVKFMSFSVILIENSGEINEKINSLLAKEHLNDLESDFDDAIIEEIIDFYKNEIMGDLIILNKKDLNALIEKFENFSSKSNINCEQILQDLKFKREKNNQYFFDLFLPLGELDLNEIKSCFEAQLKHSIFTCELKNNSQIFLSLDETQYKSCKINHFKKYFTNLPITTGYKENTIFIELNDKVQLYSNINVHSNIIYNNQNNNNIFKVINNNVDDIIYNLNFYNITQTCINTIDIELTDSNFNTLFIEAGDKLNTYCSLKFKPKNE